MGEGIFAGIMHKASSKVASKASESTPARSEPIKPMTEAELEKVSGGAKDPRWRPGGSIEIGAKVNQSNPYDLIPTHSQTKSRLKMEELIKDVKNNGINDTVKYVEHNGRKYIVDGHHRVIAAKRLGIKEIPIEQVQLPFAGYKTADDLLWFE